MGPIIDIYFFFSFFLYLFTWAVMNAKACSWRGEKEREINIFLYKKDFLIFFSLSLFLSSLQIDRNTTLWHLPLNTLYIYILFSSTCWGWGLKILLNPMKDFLFVLMAFPTLYSLPTRPPPSFLYPFLEDVTRDVAATQVPWRRRRKKKVLCDFYGRPGPHIAGPLICINIVLFISLFSLRAKHRRLTGRRGVWETLCKEEVFFLGAVGGNLICIDGITRDSSRIRPR